MVIFIQNSLQYRYPLDWYACSLTVKLMALLPLTLPVEVLTLALVNQHSSFHGRSLQKERKHTTMIQHKPFLRIHIFLQNHFF